MRPILKEPIKLWLDALRSSEFRKGRGKLENDRGEFCCLGVACKVAERNGVPVRKDVYGGVTGYTLNEQPEVMKWLGLRSGKGVFQRGQYISSQDNTLARMNDYNRYTFEQIADVIEKEIPALFKEV